MGLITNNVWKNIYKCAKENNNRYVAVAYLGKDASQYLPLELGDVLVVDASNNSVKQGKTNPFELEKYIKKGVEVYSYESLHAKVFVFGKIALIGSANVSNHSANQLKECMVEIKNSTTVSEARGFVRSLAVEPLSPKYIKYLQTIYVAPKIQGKHKNKSGTKLSEISLWIQNLEDCDYTVSEQNAYETGKKKAIKNIIDRKQYKVESIRYKDSDTFIKRAKVGDLIIKLLNSQVYPASRILGFQDSVEDNSTIMLIEESVTPNICKESNFMNKMDKFGYKQKFRKFSKQDDKDKILGFWKSIHSTTRHE